MTNPRDDLMALAERFPEINLNNYNEDDVSALNEWGKEAFDALRLAASRPATQVFDREAVARALCESGKFETGEGTCALLCMDQLGGVRKKGCNHLTRVHGKLADAILSLLRPAEPVEAKWRPIETAPKEDPERPGRDFEIIVGGGEIKDESADLLPWRPFDSWSLACYDSMRGCWRGEQTEQYDCFYLHKPTHWMPKFAGPGQCEPTIPDAVGEPVAAPRVLQIGGVTESDFGNSNALRVRFGFENGPWEWRKPTADEYQRMLAGVNNTHPPAQPDTGAAVLAERERCAAIADEWANKMALNYGRETANTIAAAIRQLPTTERGE